MIADSILTLILGFYSATTLLSPLKMMEPTQQKSIHPDVPDCQHFLNLSPTPSGSTWANEAVMFSYHCYSGSVHHPDPGSLWRR